MLRGRAWGCGALAGLLLLPLFALTPGAAASTPVLPSQDPFYTYSGPEPLGSIPPGTVLKQRSVQLAFGAGNSTPIPAEQLLYRTTGQLGAIEFVPQLPAEKIASLGKVEMGEIVRVVLQFRDRFWERITPRNDSPKSLSEMSFLFSEDEFFPTWWTSMPKKLPIITGWAAFRSAEQLGRLDRSHIIKRSLETLASLVGASLKLIENQLQATYFYDWQRDPFSRGAYSYGKVGASAAQKALAAPVANMLFFAGEATDTTGSNGTVHGAIASGYRAAKEIIYARHT